MVFIARRRFSKFSRMLRTRFSQAGISDHGVMIGSLNHGDASSDRYRPGMDTALLNHLARTVSEQLSRPLPPEEDDMPGEKN
jgi:uncharacterized protein YigA (DUF484 family)